MTVAARIVFLLALVALGACSGPCQWDNAIGMALCPYPYAVAREEDR